MHSKPSKQNRSICNKKLVKATYVSKIIIFIAKRGFTYLPNSCHQTFDFLSNMILLLILKQTPSLFFSGAIREEVKSKAGFNVDLPCVINQAECGDFHSIKWYKENRRVYVYSPIANFAKGQLIWKCLFGVFKSSKKPTNIFPGFLP